jgi:hypothetical protein
MNGTPFRRAIPSDPVSVAFECARVLALRFPSIDRLDQTTRTRILLAS